MPTLALFYTIGSLAPLALMAGLASFLRFFRIPGHSAWTWFRLHSYCALFFAALSALHGPGSLHLQPLLNATSFGQILSVLVQLLGTVIGGFSSRYLAGEARQERYAGALAAVLAGVHLLLMADHWVLLIAAWAWIGYPLQTLLCFYAERPFALLAGHKKQIADRAADLLLLAAAALAWPAVGSGSISALLRLAGEGNMPGALQWSALLLAVAVVLRTAAMPVHGWLIQVMEAPTPVSALLHAGVVNLGGYVLIRFAPFIEHAAAARALLFVFGLGTSVLAGMVTLTRVSIKVRLAWSTVAQMGFMLLECSLGLYTLAALHLLGHSLYKANAFLAASAIVRQTRLEDLRGASQPNMLSLVVAPVLSGTAVFAAGLLFGGAPWPVWWSLLLGLAWAPLFWFRPAATGLPVLCVQLLFGALAALVLTAAALAAHLLPLGIEDAPHTFPGWIALACMAALYLCLALLQTRPEVLKEWRRWSYAGFYVDETFTRIALRWWPAGWAPQTETGQGKQAENRVRAPLPT